MRRDTDGAKSWLRKPRKPINAKSASMKKRDESRHQPHTDQLKEYDYCEAQRAGMLHECFGPLEVHEPYTKARGGPQDDRRNMVTVCSHANRLISQDAPSMKWALEHGFLVRGFDGEAWLEAGGIR